MVKIKPIKNVYVVMNFGNCFRDLFYHYHDAQSFVEREGIYTGKAIYQIYKCDVSFSNVILKDKN